jgi:WD40 repeat protein
MRTLRPSVTAARTRHVVRHAVIVGGLALLAGSARAQLPPGMTGTFTDSSRILAVAPAARPSYLAPSVDPQFRVRLLRITNDPGTPVAPVAGVWGTDARHVYSKQQPWNATGKLLSVQNRKGAARSSPIILDGETYQPLFTPCDAYDNWDYRWHPSPAHANEQIAVNKAGTELMWFDVVNCKKSRSWKLPFPADYGIGSGEGNVSADGRYVVISDSTRMVVVDMDPRGPNAPAYPHRRIGPVYTFDPCSLSTRNPNFCPNGNISISPSGRYIDLKFGSGGVDCDTLCDLHRIFEVDSGLVIRPHNMASNSLRCGSFAARPNGWVFPLKHADMALDPFDGNEDVLIGGRACPGSNLGRTVKVRLRDGKVTPLTDPKNEASFMHASARNTARPGWVYVSYARGMPGKRYNGEILAVKLDGSGQVERFGFYHSTAKPYRAEAHPVPSPDGRRVMFASDWADDCGAGCGSKDVINAYIYDARDTTAAPRPQAKAPRPR